MSDIPPIDTTGKDIIRFPKGHKPPPDGALMLVPPSQPPGACSHHFTQFEVDTESHACKCLGCGQSVSPYVVLDRLMRQESQWMRTREAYLGEMARLKERSRTKCQHCGEMTRISRS